MNETMETANPAESASPAPASGDAPANHANAPGADVGALHEAPADPAPAYGDAQAPLEDARGAVAKRLRGFDPDPANAPADPAPVPAPAADTLRRWSGEAAALAARVPDFDLAAEARSPEFRALLRAGLPLERAWAAVHFDELLDGAVRAAAELTEKRVTDDLRARARRPAEAGLGALAPAAGRRDVSALSRRDRADIARRAARGERITF